MKKTGKGMTRERSFCLLLVVAVLHLIFVTCEFPFLFHWADSSLSSPSRRIHQVLEGKVEIYEKKALIRPDKRSTQSSLEISSLSFNLSDINGDLPFSKLHEKAFSAWEKGGALLKDLQSGNLAKFPEKPFADEACPRSISLSSTEFKKRGGLMILPCGLTFGSKITVVAKPTKYLVNDDPEMKMMLSQFMMELQGLKVVDGEDPPRILHFNPRLKGDWSQEPVIEMNTCYRMQWGTPLRCDGRRSGEKEETVDGKVKCEKWNREEDERLENSKSTRWFSGLAGQTKESPDLTYPFVEGRLFALTLSAGSEGYHIHVNGRHISSFAYRTGFALEDATGLALTGDIEVQSVLAEALPASHLSFSLQNLLELSRRWKSPPLTEKPVELFVGVLSAGNHFVERMAVRKSWMQSAKRSQSVVTRFFVGMHARNEINFLLKKEAEFFGDVVIVPFMDSYDLVVLKTLAICEYGVKRVSAKYILKCDDDTFVRIDSVLEEARKVSANHSLYMGNINYFHNPQRDGKWAVTYEEWPEEIYPPYANGAGYVISSDIAQFIVSEFEKHRLRLFKMEDVSVGMWVEQFYRARAVEYVHSVQYCQFGCVDDYLTAHYQSPRQMICLWDKLRAGKTQCCDS